MESTQKPQYLTVQEVAGELECQPADVLELIEARKLPAIRPRGEILVHRAWLDAYIRKQAQ